MLFGLRPRVLKHCPAGHVMQMTWRTCPRCSGRGATDETPGRDITERTVILGAPPAPAPVVEVAPPTWVALLVVERGPLAGREIEIPPGRWKLGRSPRAEAGFELVALADPVMSRDHFALEAGVAAVVLRDLGSTNGTFVNGTRLERRILQEGDAIGAGESVLRVRLALRPPSCAACGSPRRARPAWSRWRIAPRSGAIPRATSCSRTRASRASTRS